MRVEKLESWMTLLGITKTVFHEKKAIEKFTSDLLETLVANK